MAYATMDNRPSLGGVGMSLQSGTSAETIVKKHLKLLDGGDFSILEVPDKQYDKKIDGEPFRRSSAMLASHAAGDISKLLLAPGNYIEEMIGCYLGNSYVSTPVYTVALATGHGTLLTQGTVVHGETSKARGKVVKVVGDTVWLCEVQGTFLTGEDLYTQPGVVGSDTGANVNATPAHTALSVYAHWNKSVVYFTNVSTVAALETATHAFISDLMVDFRNAQVTSGDRRNRVEVVDAAATPIRLSGYIGAACQCVPFNEGTATFTAVKTLTAGGSTVGEIIYVDLRSGTWLGGDAAGFLWVTPDPTTPIQVADDAVLADDSTPAGAAVANCPTTKANPWNAAYVYDDVDGLTQSWKGDVSSFDNTGTLTYEVVQRLFTSKTLTMFGQLADGRTEYLQSAKIKEIAFPFSNNDDPVMDVSLEGIAKGFCTTEPTFPDVVTTLGEWGLGVSNRAVYVDGSEPSTYTVLSGDISLSRSFDAERKRSYSSLTPTELLDGDPEIVGKMVATFETDELRQKLWRGDDSSTGPEAGAFNTMRLLFDLKSESVITGSVYYEMIIRMFGLIDPEEKPDKSPEGYTRTITLTGAMLDSTYKWGPFDIVFIDGETSH
jgi:hypothetical protein